MKHIKSLIAVALLALTGIASAQTTNTPPGGITDFGNTVLGFLTSFNTNLDTTFRDNRFELWTGVDSSKGLAAPIENSLGFSYDLWRPTQANTNSATWTSVGVENLVRSTGVAGSIVADQLGVSFSVVVHDFKLTGYLDGGYDLNLPDGTDVSKRLYGEVGLRAKKALGSHFYTGVGFGVQFPRNGQLLSAFAGATF